MKKIIYKIKRYFKSKYRTWYRGAFKKRLRLEWQIKFALRTYYDGHTDYDDYGSPYQMIKPKVTNISLMSLGITNLEFIHKRDTVIFIITLQRPGMFIGKGGRNFDAVTEYLTERVNKKIIIRIKESKLW